MLKSHWNLRYVIDRLRLNCWLQSNPNCPWFTRQAVELLEDWIKPTDIVLEFGSGRSTTWLAARVNRVTSVEQSPEWYAIVTGDLAKRSLASKVDIRLVPGGNAVDAYSGVAQEFPESHFDIVIVDGHFRRECILAASSRVKPGGILIYDDSQVHADAARQAPKRHRAFQPMHARTEYHRGLWEPVFASLENWRLVWTTDGVKDTAIWIKPAP
jgi:predicted O-methyltransferase YrrM